ncbi:unnamed protein product, partial [marine sediment metagenome]
GLRPGNGAERATSSLQSPRTRPPKQVSVFVDLWMADFGSEGNAVGAMARGLLTSRRPELMTRIPGHLGALAADHAFATAIAQINRPLILATDEIVNVALARLLAMPASTAGQSLEFALAAKVERDWEGSRELLASLPPEARANALLMIPGMTRYRDSLPDAVSGR